MHQMMQAILTVVIHPLLGCRTMSVQESASLRLIAAKALAEFIALFSGNEAAGGYLGIGEVLVGVYSKILYSPDTQPITTLLGAVIVSRERKKDR